MKGNNLVSVIIPVYNACHYISRTIESVISQKSVSLELVVVDDGSTDESGVICDDFKRKDNRINVIHQKNGGVMSARMAGLQACRGEWAFFLDSDDILPENALKVLLDTALQQKPDIVCGGRAFINSDDLSIYGQSIKWEKGTLRGIEFQRKMCIKPSSLSGKLYNSSILKEANIIIDRKIRNNEDYLYNLFLSPRISKVEVVEDVVYYIIRRAGSLSNQKYDNKYWYDFFYYLEDNIRKYGVNRSNYLLFKLGRISSLVLGESRYKFDFSNPVFEDVRTMQFNKNYGLYKNMVLFAVKYPNALTNKILQLRPRKLLRNLINGASK